MPRLTQAPWRCTPCDIAETIIACRHDAERLQSELTRLHAAALPADLIEAIVIAAEAIDDKNDEEAAGLRSSGSSSQFQYASTASCACNSVTFNIVTVVSGRAFRSRIVFCRNLFASLIIRKPSPENRKTPWARSLRALGARPRVHARDRRRRAGDVDRDPRLRRPRATNRADRAPL
jgi:hypothetical protein